MKRFYAFFFSIIWIILGCVVFFLYNETNEIPSNIVVEDNLEVIEKQVIPTTDLVEDIPYNVPIEDNLEVVEQQVILANDPMEDIKNQKTNVVEQQKKNIIQIIKTLYFIPQKYRSNTIHLNLEIYFNIEGCVSKIEIKNIKDLIKKFDWAMLNALLRLEDTKPIKNIQNTELAGQSIDLDLDLNCELSLELDSSD